ncbi:MAG: hypothetical protein D6692_03915 [Planctomycetota bacterium]|nr:MAG: hypothetical protein D6692_03915 [Planctomycetota bacterium]
MDRVGSSIPFNAAMAAYGRPLSVRPAQAAQTARPAERTEPIAQIGAVKPVASEPRPSANPSRLVAARVDPIDLSRDVDAVGGRATGVNGYPMYRHPADRNQAATGVALGRSLDVQG